MSFRRQRLSQARPLRPPLRAVPAAGAVLGVVFFGATAASLAAPPTHVPIAPAPSLALAPSPATPPPAAVAPATGLSVAFGDSIDKVRAAYDIRGEPSNGCGSRDPCLTLRAPAIGLMFFFKTDSKRLYEIRADAPFSGSIEGVRIGDALDDLLRRLGQPAKPPWDFGANEAYLFKLHGVSLRCDIDDAKKVATIFYFND
jgi:hypothetical protein